MAVAIIAYSPSLNVNGYIMIILPFYAKLQVWQVLCKEKFLGHRVDRVGPNHYTESFKLKRALRP